MLEGRGEDSSARQMEEMRIAECGLRNLEAVAEPVAATVPLHPRFRIGRKTLTGLLVSKRPQTAVAIGPHYP